MEVFLVCQRVAFDWSKEKEATEERSPGQGSTTHPRVHAALTSQSAAVPATASQTLQTDVVLEARKVRLEPRAADDPEPLPLSYMPSTSLVSLESCTRPCPGLSLCSL